MRINHVISARTEIESAKQALIRASVGLDHFIASNAEKPQVLECEKPKNWKQTFSSTADLVASIDELQGTFVPELHKDFPWTKGKRYCLFWYDFQKEEWQSGPSNDKRNIHGALDTQVK